MYTNNKSVVDLLYQEYAEWKDWKQKPMSRSNKSALKDLAATKVLPPAELLEIGFGNGDFMRQVIKLGYLVTGIERAVHDVEQMRSEGFNVFTWQEQQLGLSKFDICVSLDVFEHLSLTELHICLENIHGLLKPDGLLLARFPNAASPFGMINQHSDATHVQQLSGRSFAQIARLNGFELQSISNPAYVWLDGTLSWALLSIPRFLIRRLIEAVLCVAYFGVHSKLDLDVMVILRKPYMTN